MLPSHRHYEKIVNIVVAIYISSTKFIRITLYSNITVSIENIMQSIFSRSLDETKHKQRL